MALDILTMSFLEIYPRSTMPLTALNNDQKSQLIKELHPDWNLSGDGTSVSRNFKTKGFSQALSLANLCGTLADVKNHHPDIHLGWGYCKISFTTHSVAALTSLDIECAKKLDALSVCLFDKP